MDDIYKYIEEYNLIEKRKVLIAFHGIIVKKKKNLIL